jgi:hypothetical protein
LFLDLKNIVARFFLVVDISRRLEVESWMNRLCKWKNRSINSSMVYHHILSGNLYWASRLVGELQGALVNLLCTCTVPVISSHGRATLVMWGTPKLTDILPAIVWKTHLCTQTQFLETTYWTHQNRPRVDYWTFKWPLYTQVAPRIK